MNNPRSQKQRNPSFYRKQRGAALILIAFILGLAVTALMSKSLTVTSIQAGRNEETIQALKGAKDAIIGWAIAYEAAPGQLPWPDRRETSNPNYDGHSDCNPSNFNLINSQGEPNFLGQIPYLETTAPCNGYPGIGNQFRDSSGNNLWYAVSRNLVRNYSASEDPDPIINPGTIESPTYPWMVIRDAVTGTIISNRVAVVIIAPGPPLNSQNRSSTAPLPVNFLDQITINGVAYSNLDYDQDDEDFIMGDSDNNSFNDTLTYITIDELIAALEKRVAAEAKAALLAYRSDNGGEFPFASPIGSALNYSCKDDLTEGFLPLDSSVAFNSPVSCTSGNNCSGIDFDDISSVTFTNTTVTFNWTGSSGNCTRSGRSCTCTGAGSCTIFGVINYSCNSTGTCTANLVNGSSAFVPKNTDVISTTGSAAPCGSRVTVPATGGATFTGATCSNPGLSPKFIVNKSSGNNNLTLSTTPGFNDQLIRPGMYIFGTGIQDGTVVRSVNSNTSLTMSKSATAAGSGEIRISRLQPWFFENGWSNYIYYGVSNSPAGLTVGSKSEVEAVLITIGKEITDSPFAESKGASQSRASSCSAKDYLDSDANASNDEIYDASNKPIKSNYNDQIFIVSP